MSTNTIDAQLCARMFLAGARRLESKKEWINELNVFPVPDGDTGTNMTMTIMSAAGEISAMQEYSMDRVAKAMSSGSLRGARGNSGVILSQLFRGFCKVIRDHQQLDTAVLTQALQKATETAYKAVMKPKEGTILTVARGISEKASALVEENPEIALEDLLVQIVETAEIVLAGTPDLLPVLKEAGVVDSGGQGLVQILKGALDSFQGKEEPQEQEASGASEESEKSSESLTEAVKYEYSVELTVFTEDVEGTDPERQEVEKQVGGFLSEIGKGMSSRTTENFLKIHLLTNQPGLALQKAMELGRLVDIRVDNLKKEEILNHKKELEEEREKAQQPWKEVGFVAVSIGDGLADIFRDLGVDCLIEGGQTMNPSTEDFINAIESVHAKTIFVFPNNKNIILAASQAQTLVKSRNVIMIPTKTIPQGITALINYLPDKTPHENETNMYTQIQQVRTGQLTYAVRDTHVDDKEIHQGDFMGVGDSGILAVGEKLEKTAIDTVAQMVTEDSELISIYYGSDIAEQEAQMLTDQLSELYPDCEVELNQGGQPIYYYIISVE